MKLRRVRWAGHVACMGEIRNTRFWSENLKGRYYLEDLGIDRKLLSEWITEK
jgi:hypothetical protein